MKHVIIISLILSLVPCAFAQSETTKIKVEVEISSAMVPLLRGAMNHHYRRSLETPAITEHLKQPVMAEIKALLDRYKDVLRKRLLSEAALSDEVDVVDAEIASERQEIISKIAERNAKDGNE